MIRVKEALWCSALDIYPNEARWSWWMGLKMHAIKIYDTAPFMDRRALSPARPSRQCQVFATHRFLAASLTIGACTQAPTLHLWLLHSQVIFSLTPQRTCERTRARAVSADLSGRESSISQPAHIVSRLISWNKKQNNAQAAQINLSWMQIYQINRTK